MYRKDVADSDGCVLHEVGPCHVGGTGRGYATTTVELRGGRRGTGGVEYGAVMGRMGACPTIISARRSGGVPENLFLVVGPGGTSGGSTRFLRRFGGSRGP